MKFEIYYYADEKNFEPVRAYIQDLTDEQKAKVYAYLQHLSDVGPKIKRPQGDYLGGKTGLYEIRPGRNRVLYFFIQGGKIVLVHAFLKKSDAIPEKDLKIAIRRKEMCEVLLRFNRVEFDQE